MAIILRHRLEAGAQTTMKAAFWQPLHDREQPMRNRRNYRIRGIGRISLANVCRATALLLFVSAAGAQAPSVADAPIAWPQSFSIAGPKEASFGFPVTQPGQIVVEIQVQGAPVAAVLHGSQAVQTQGTGPLRLTYTATAEDVRNAIFWGVNVRLVQPAPQGAAANVTMSVQYPPADIARVQAAVGEARTRAHARRAQRPPQLQPHSNSDAIVQQERAELAQLRAQHQASLLAPHQAELAGMRAGAGLSTRGISASRAPIFLAPARPVIAQLSIGQGEPGDPVMITGTGFGSAGEVHFVIGNGVDEVGRGTVWSGSQIFTNVPGPAAGGLIAYGGTVYLKRSDQVQSNLVGFGFTPTLDRRVIVLPPPSANCEGRTCLQNATLAENGTDVFAQGGVISHLMESCFQGHWGDDQFFANLQFKNGWSMYRQPYLVSGVSESGPYSVGGGDGMAVAMPVALNGPSPLVDVTWWLNVQPGCASDLGYTFTMYIQGPLGTPDGIVIP
jgi:hypothetical protein